jgi:hypothetical protein
LRRCLGRRRRQQPARERGIAAPFRRRCVIRERTP